MRLVTWKTFSFAAFPSAGLSAPIWRSHLQTGHARPFVFDFRERWKPVVEASGKKFDPKLLSAQDQQDIRKFSFSSVKLPCVLARSTAMLAWDTVRPRDLRCPTLCMIGTENTHALEASEEYDKELPYSKVQVRLFEGMTHEQEFENIEQVLPGIMEFFRGEAK